MNELKKIDEAFGRALNPEIAERIRQEKERKSKKERKSIEEILIKLGDDLIEALRGEK